MRLTIFLLCVSALFSCRSKKYSSFDEPEIQKLVFTEGGGFAGIYTSYALLENGQLFKSKGKVTNYQEIQSLSKPLTQELFRRFHNIDAPDIKNGYGNMTYTLKYYDPKEKFFKEHIWTEYQDGTETYQRYYDFSVRSIKNYLSYQNDISSNPK